MSFERVKPFAEAITGAHMGPTPSWARSLEVLPWREHPRSLKMNRTIEDLAASFATSQGVEALDTLTRSDKCKLQ